jgi:hypothetical protein
VSDRRWLISERADFWFACAGASGALIAALFFIILHGDRELDWLDLVLSELHLGATYDAIARRRLWRQRPVDIVAVPLIILVATITLMAMSQALLVTTVAMYTAIWHRGRQNFGIGRFYLRLTGGPVSRTHVWLFSAAIYAPMMASAFLYSHFVPDHYEGEPYFNLDFGLPFTSAFGIIALGCVIVYLCWTWKRQETLHPGERWVVLAHSVAFASAYILGASRASFLFVLTVYHEVQYLYFTYAMARWPVRAVVSEVRFAGSFAIWPLTTLGAAIAFGWYEGQWLAPFGLGGLFCHYWLDGRIWTRRFSAHPMKT